MIECVICGKNKELHNIKFIANTHNVCNDCNDFHEIWKGENRQELDVNVLRAIHNQKVIEDESEKILTPTPAEQRVISAIKQFQDFHEYPPTIRDIMEILELKSTAGVHLHMKNLREKSLIKKQDGVARSITLNQ